MVKKSKFDKTKKIIACVWIFCMMLLSGLCLERESTNAAYVKSLTLSKGSVSLSVREQKTLNYKIKCKGNASRWLKYESSDPQLVRVGIDKSHIYIQGLKLGKTTITFYTEGTNRKHNPVKKTLRVTVKLPEKSELGFRSESYLQEHFEKHGKEMGFATAVDYERAAAEVVFQSGVKKKIEEEDGDFVYYLQETNELVIVSTDGYIRTYFKPDDGIDYFNRTSTGYYPIREKQVATCVI